MSSLTSLPVSVSLSSPDQMVITIQTVPIASSTNVSGTITATLDDASSTQVCQKSMVPMSGISMHVDEATIKLAIDPSKSKNTFDGIVIHHDPHTAPTTTTDGMVISKHQGASAPTTTISASIMDSKRLSVPIRQASSGKGIITSTFSLCCSLWFLMMCVCWYDRA
jgi:hypothetical protein